MALFPRRIQLPGPTGDARLDSWTRKVTEALSESLAAYGEMYYPFSESVLTMSGVADSFTTFTSFLSTDEEFNLSSSTDASLFTVRIGGVYQLGFNANVSGPNNTEFSFELHRNSSEISHGTRLNIINAGDIESADIAAIQRFRKDDTISVHVKSDNASGADLGTYNSSFDINRIGT